MEKINIDLNSLFNLSYNFENLKLLLTTISKNQDIFESKIKDIEKKLNNINLNQPKESSIDKSEKENSSDKKDTKITRDFQKFKTGRERQTLTYDDLNLRIIDLEDQVKLLYNFIPKFPEDKTKTLNNILDEHQLNIDNNNTEIKEMKDQVDKMKSSVDEINIKMNDIDIYDIVKDIQFSGGDIEASKILIQSLERKTEARFKFLEEKIKDDEQAAQKMKTDITDIKNNSTIQKNSLTILREQMIKLQSEVDSNKRNLSEKIKKNEIEIENLKESQSKNLESINNQFQNISMNLYDVSNQNKKNVNMDKLTDVIKEEKNEDESSIKKGTKTKDNISDTEVDKSEER